MTVYDTVLNRSNAKVEIDKAFRMAALYKKTVYIGVLEDIVTSEIEEGSDESTDVNFNTSEENLKRFIHDFKNILEKTREHIFVFDNYIDRYGLQEDAKKLIEKAKIPFATLTLGRAVISDDNKYSVGVYRTDSKLCNKADLSILAIRQI